MDIIAIIPARYGSNRLPGKPLVDIGGKPMIQRVYERVRSCTFLQEVIVATDDERILECCNDFGARAEMTSDEHISGTDRIAEVARALHADLIVNIQGDEPFIDPRAIQQAVEPLQGDPEIVMGSVKVPISKQKDILDPNVVKVVTDQNDFALYFSRTPIPFCRNKEQQPVGSYFKHLGIYVYRKAFLLKFTTLQPTLLEKSEGLEQLRALEYGYRLKVPTTPFDSLHVDTSDDLERVRQWAEQKAF